MGNSLLKIYNHFCQIGLPLTVCVSLIGNSMNIAVLCRRKMKKHACCLYFMALSCNNLIYASTILVISVLDDGYQIKITSQSLIACKLVTYFGTLLSALSPSFIVLASIDRWNVSSLKPKRRKWSNAWAAKLSIASVTIFFSLLFIISIVVVDIYENDVVRCRIRGDSLFIQIYNAFHFVLFSFVAPILMTIFGSLTIHNIKQYRLPGTVLSRTRRTETQLVRMLLIQVGVQLLFTLPICVVGLLISFPSIYQPRKSFYSIVIVCRVIFQFNYATPFFLYIMSAHRFRKECERIIKKSILNHIYRRILLSRRSSRPPTSTRQVIACESVL